MAHDVQVKAQPGSIEGQELFTRLLLASSDGTDLAEFSTESLADHADAALGFIADKPKGQHKVRTRPAILGQGNARAPATVIEILNDDMPFLVDSVMGEIQARSLKAKLVLHPIFKTRRSSTGALQAITGAGDRAWSDGTQESYISVHIDPLSGSAGREIVNALSRILDGVRLAVADWQPMLERVRTAIRDLEANPPDIAADLHTESIAFLRWLVDGQFTFLGARDFRLKGDVEQGELVADEGAGLGLLRDPAMQVLRRGTELVALTPEVRRFFFEPASLIITKSNVVSRIHRRAHMDYIGIKLYGSDKRPAGELRIVGLFTSSAYTQSPRQIPILRHKVERVLQSSGHPPESHAGKALINVLETFPRDELFQIAPEDLSRWTAGILDLELRPRVRVFTRVDRFDRFVSLLVFVPRDGYSSTVRERIGNYLAESYSGYVSAFFPYFTDGPLVRVQFIIGRREGLTPSIDVTALERGIAAIVRTWSDQLTELLAAHGDDAEVMIAKYGRAFPAGYIETFLPARALEDIGRIERLGLDRPMAIDLYREIDSPETRVRAAIYRFDAPMRLSERVPVLENLGFSVIDERSYRVVPDFETGKREVVLHDMVLESADGTPIDRNTYSRIEDCFLAVFRGEADNDGFNRLVITAGAAWREAATLRAYAALLRQLGSPFGLRYIADTLNRHAGVARDLLEVFHVRFNPDSPFCKGARKALEEPVRARIEGALANVPSLDEDRILRQLLSLISATLRTNFYQRSAGSAPPETISFKLSGKDLDMAPQPRSYREIWVYSPRVEGVHLRFAPIARGGIRWSDRAQDFRTEVLGLAKAQQVKNAVIVPAGAKGGFYPKQIARNATREEMQKEGVAAYSIFVSALLDITDNIKDGAIVPPPRVVRHDPDDPYLVVAADKGTATFSDTANGIAMRHGFWLGDAFASGGSAGYDHKGMAITARGAWECVKRHFRELDIDIQRTPFTVIGVGDMSGDVFGNGMLLSPVTKLLAAFDHRDIFIDPDPDPALGLAERKRLFNLARSSWQDYDKTKISKGGGVFSRTSKSVQLSAEMRNLISVEVDSLTPAELIRALLQAKTDLLWFGGIGTYVRASAETDLDVGDRANDPLRVTAAQVQARVIGEGANLGVTQPARIEFANRGGRINTDFIDNSAGVNTSDQEVNIKIALGPAVKVGQLDAAGRKALLARMTDDVAAAVLRNNYQQSLALSIAERRSAVDLGFYGRLIRHLEQRGLLDRTLEALPSEAELMQRTRAAAGLARPELAVLLSYAKIALLHDLLASKVPDEPFMEELLYDYFPPALRDPYAHDIGVHRLRREIIATTLTNGIVNRCGPATALRLAEEAARPISEVAHAFMATRAVFSLADIWRRIDALDSKVPGAVQLDLYGRIQQILNRNVAWFLRHDISVGSLTEAIGEHKAGFEGLRQRFVEAATPGGVRRRDELEVEFSAKAIPDDIARDVAYLAVLKDAPAIVDIARASDRSIIDAARVFLAVGDRFALDDLLARTAQIKVADDYDRLAIAGAEGALADARRSMTLAALAVAGSEGTDLEIWVSRQRDRILAAEQDLGAIMAVPELTVSRLTVAATRLADIARTQG
jgi:glutamate dehydrogenase